MDIIDLERYLHTAICNAVELMYLDPEISRAGAGREALRVLQQALINYADVVEAEERNR